MGKNLLLKVINVLFKKHTCPWQISFEQLYLFLLTIEHQNTPED